MQNVCVCELLSCVFTYMKILFLMRCLPLFVCFQKRVESWDVCYISWFLKILLLYIIITCPFRISLLVMNGDVPASCLYWSNAVFSGKKKRQDMKIGMCISFFFASAQALCLSLLTNTCIMYCVHGNKAQH